MCPSSDPIRLKPLVRFQERGQVQVEDLVGHGLSENALFYQCVEGVERSIQWVVAQNFVGLHPFISSMLNQRLQLVFKFGDQLTHLR